MEKMTKVLVVDDEKVVREGCRRVLSGKGFEVFMAENGQNAMNILSEEDIDLILLDLKMPVMSGEEVLEKVHELYQDIPVIIITGHGTVDTAVDCMKKGAYDFITKPFQIEQFMMTVNRASDKRRLEIKAKQFEQENVKNLYDLNLEKSRLKTMINCMANGVMVANRNMEVVLHNPALMRLLEINEKIENPFSVEKIINNNDLISTLNKIQDNGASENTFITQEIKAGKNMIRAITAPAVGPDDGIVGTVTVLEDITAFKKLDEMKSDFINMVAHELRSPLVSIRQQNSVLVEGLAGPLEEKQKDFLGRGIKKIDQLLELINDLLEMAKIEAGKDIQHQVATDIQEIVEETVALVEARAKESNIEISCLFEDLNPVKADPKRIMEVINNLITNAINYSPEGGEVKVLLKGMGEYIEIRISDNGVGIDEEELPKIFDKFYRVKHPKTRKVMGTGLGLAIVKGIIDAHQGTIDVESTINKGTTFRILLPIISTDE